MYSIDLDSINDLSRFIAHGDQTVTYFGLSESSLDQLTEICLGRGVDRIVPVGRALEFSHIWDGKDLIAEMTRIVHRI